jgi:hypothetical protein
LFSLTPSNIRSYIENTILFFTFFCVGGGRKSEFLTLKDTYNYVNIKILIFRTPPKYEATDKHPAQTELLSLDFQVGKYETTYLSGKISVVQKNEMVKRIEKMIEAVKIARAKANNVDVVNIALGKKIFDYIQKDILDK